MTDTDLEPSGREPLAKRQASVTLLDVAAAAGVSRSTASRALNDSSLISADARDRVHEASKRLGYKPDRNARALRLQRSNLVGLVMSNLSNASFHTMAEVIQNQLDAAGYRLMLCIAHREPEVEDNYLEMLAEFRAEGVIVVGSGQSAHAEARLLEAGTAVVNLVRKVEGGQADNVLADDTTGASQATRYLLGLGHTRIAFIGAPVDSNSGYERYAGYVRALDEAGVPVDAELVRHVAFSDRAGAEAVAELLDSDLGITALFVANHEAAFGVIPELSRRKVSIPDQLSLLCYEDVPWFRWWSPAITVVDTDAASMAKLAVEVLLERMRQPLGGQDTGRIHRVESHFIPRDSCAPVAR